MKNLSRREFGAMFAAGLLGVHFPEAVASEQTGALAVPLDDIIDRIRRNLDVEWRDETVDGVKAGDPSHEVTGVVTTAMASLPVLRQTVARGANFIITPEPTFYSQSDARAPRAPRGGPGAAEPRSVESRPAEGNAPTAPTDPIFDAKNALIDENRLVVFRLSDHWRLRSPDPFVQGLARAFGWSSLGDVSRYDIPPTTLEALASVVNRELGARGGVRVIGERATPVRRVALLPGTTAIDASLATLPTVDVVIAGEVREWESVEYVRDVVAADQPKGFITVGRVLSEDPGMRLMAEWLGAFVTEVPVQHISAGDPYWRPAS